MIKKILITFLILFLCGCTKIRYINDMSYEQIINSTIKNTNDLFNINSVGYKYFMPIDFKLISDDNFTHILSSHGNLYYLNIDPISYYYKKNMIKEEKNVYYFYKYNTNNKDGYLKIVKNNDYFFVEICYNYAIIETEIKEKDIKFAVSRAITILNSIKYNDLVIEDYIDKNDINSSESNYEIKKPENKNDTKNVLEYNQEND